MKATVFLSINLMGICAGIYTKLFAALNYQTDVLHCFNRGNDILMKKFKR